MGEVDSLKNNKMDNDASRTTIISTIRGSLQSNLENDTEKIFSYMTNGSNWTNKSQSLLTIRNALEILYAHLVILLTLNQLGLTNKIDTYKDKLRSKKNALNGTKQSGGTNTVDIEKKGGAQQATPSGESDNSDMSDRIDNIISIINRVADKNINDTEFVTELNRTATIVINSNILPISSGVQTLIKDLNENNEKRIIIDKNTDLINGQNAIFGNDKYKDTNYKTLTDAILKDVKTFKKIVNFSGSRTLTADSIRDLTSKIQTSSKPEPANDESGIIYDNNNVTTPKYEIYLYVDFIDGKITDDNKNNLDLCKFRDELLLIKFNQLINNEIHMLQHDPLIKMLDSTPDAPKQEVKLKVGGNTKKNRIFSNVNNRTKKYE